MPPGLVIGDADAPEEADEAVAVLVAEAGGEEAGEFAGAADDLIEFIFGECAVVAADEPVGAPWVAAVDAVGGGEVAEFRACAIGDDEEVEAAGDGFVRGEDFPFTVGAAGIGDFHAPVDVDAGGSHGGDELF